MGQIRVLVVDDTELMRKMLKHILCHTEFEVVGEAGDGQKAVALFEELSPDLVLMDIIMPNVSGLDALRMITERSPSARVVMCSALGQEQTVHEALQAGARDFISKPFLPDNVLETLRSVVA